MDFDSSDAFRRKHNTHELPSLITHPKYGVVEKEIIKVGDGVNLASRMRHQRGNVQKGSIQTLKAQMEIGVVVDDEES